MSCRHALCVLATVFSWAAASQARSAIVEINWIAAGDGQWFDPANWDPRVVPDNGVDQYHVSIDNDLAASIVTIDGVASILDLAVTFGDSLVISEASRLTVEGEGVAISNDGTIRLQPTTTGAVLSLASSETILYGLGTIELSGPLSAINGTGTLTHLNHRIEGAGRVGENTISIINRGIIVANQSTSPLVIDPAPAGGFKNRSTFGALDGATLQLSGAGGGSFENSEFGVIIANGSVELVENASLTNRAGGALFGIGRLDTQQGSFFNEGYVLPGGVLVGTLTVSGDVALGASSQLQIAIRGKSPGQDYDQLMITGHATLDGALALEEFTFDFQPTYGDTFNVVQYGSHDGAFDSVYLPKIAGGVPLRLFYGSTRITIAVALDGDADLDGDVDLGDLNAVRNNFGATGVEIDGDTNFDEAVDLEDLNAVRNNFGASASNAVPEPASMVLALSALCLGVLARRRV